MHLSCDLEKWIAAGMGFFLGAATATAIWLLRDKSGL
jgi:hypothetical protein